MLWSERVRCAAFLASGVIFRMVFFVFMVTSNLPLIYDPACHRTAPDFILRAGSTFKVGGGVRTLLHTLDV